MIQKTRSISITWKKSRFLGPTPGLLDQNPQLNKIPQVIHSFIGTLKLEKYWSGYLRFSCEDTRQLHLHGVHTFAWEADLKQEFHGQHWRMMVISARKGTYQELGHAQGWGVQGRFPCIGYSEKPE